MKTHTDSTANQKGSPTQAHRSGSDASMSSTGTDKDSKHAGPAKLPATGDAPKAGIDVRAGGGSPAVGKPAADAEAKPGSARSDAGRKPS